MYVYICILLLVYMFIHLSAVTLFVEFIISLVVICIPHVFAFIESRRRFVNNHISTVFEY